MVVDSEDDARETVICMVAGCGATLGLTPQSALAEKLTLLGFHRQDVHPQPPPQQQQPPQVGASLQQNAFQDQN